MERLPGLAVVLRAEDHAGVVLGRLAVERVRSAVAMAGDEDGAGVWILVELGAIEPSDAERPRCVARLRPAVFAALDDRRIDIRAQFPAHPAVGRSKDEHGVARAS